MKQRGLSCRIFREGLISCYVMMSCDRQEQEMRRREKSMCPELRIGPLRQALNLRFAGTEQCPALSCFFIRDSVILRSGWHR